DPLQDDEVVHQVELDARAPLGPRDTEAGDPARHEVLPGLEVLQPHPRAGLQERPDHLVVGRHDDGCGPGRPALRDDGGGDRRPDEADALEGLVVDLAAESRAAHEMPISYRGTSCSSMEPVPEETRSIDSSTSAPGGIGEKSKVPSSAVTSVPSSRVAIWT